MPDPQPLLGARGFLVLTYAHCGPGPEAGHHLGAWPKCGVPGPIPDLLKQNLGQWDAAIWVFTSPQAVLRHDQVCETQV